MAIHWEDDIEEQPEVMLGKPVFKGTRLTVEHILMELGGGMPEDEILRNYPRLKREHLRAAIQGVPPSDPSASDSPSHFWR